MKNTAEDLMFLVGNLRITTSFNPIKRKWQTQKKVDLGSITKIQIEAENAWLDGKDADYNPFPDGSPKYWIWRDQWILCNKNC